MTPTTVAVCVPTLRRPAWMRQLLESLVALETPGAVVTVVVVDNDPAGSSRELVESFRPALPGLIYEVEPRAGISSARNRLVAVARRLGVDYIASIDDDEWVEPDWLARLLELAARGGADVVCGPVLPEAEPGVPGWVLEGRFFERDRHASGAEVRWLCTCNALFRCTALAAFDEPFDRRFDLTGGSDTHLAERLSRAGARMVWCDEAIVREHLPANRAGARWILRRAYRLGITQSRVVRLVEPSAGRLADRALRSLGHLLVGAGQLVLALPRGRPGTIRALHRAARGLGGIVGLVGVTYAEYRPRHE